MKKGLLTIVALASLVGLVGCKSDASSGSKAPSVKDLAYEAGAAVFGLQVAYEYTEFEYDEEDETKVTASQLMLSWTDGVTDNYVDAFYMMHGTEEKEGLMQGLIEKYNMVMLSNVGGYYFDAAHTIPALGAIYGIQLKGTEYLAVEYFSIDANSVDPGAIYLNIEVEIIDIAAEAEEQ